MDALLALASITSFYMAFRRIGLWRWFWLGLSIYLGIFELASKLIVGKTLSQQYWAWAAISPWWWLPAMLVAVGGIGLALHLVWKRLPRR